MTAKKRIFTSESAENQRKVLFYRFCKNVITKIVSSDVSSHAGESLRFTHTADISRRGSLS